ncbi:MAG TPA: S8 family serine peptidase [Candidatus Limnocylindrales bacterium]|nr:S8 family serine peptidase [Candidatus Limnocylindrales bacterium]
MSRALLAVALTGSMLSIGHPATASAPTPAATPLAASSTGAPTSALITLVTGDRILVQGDSYQVLDTPARRDVTFLSYKHEGHLNVIPSDAVGLLGSQLDNRLFDVTALVEMGYGAGRDLGLIIQHGKDAKADDKAKTRSSVAKGGGSIGADLPMINALAVKEKQAKAGSLWTELTTGDARGRRLKSEVAKIWLDGVQHTSLDQSVPQVGAPTAWAAGFDGTGVKVGIVDSGIDSTHPDLAGKVVAAADFTGEGLQDLAGHGTHVASTVAGTGAGSGGQFKGVAPGATLVSGKACIQSGACFDSSLLQAMQWTADQGVDVINMSLGGPDLPGVDPLEAAVNSLTASHGVLFVIAAGNTGPPVPSYTVSSPSTADSALSVGAVDPGNGLAFFSNRGPRVGDTAIKPEITAPGLGITAARSSTSSLPGDLYTDLNGTSMATPHVAGAAAIIAQRNPSWTPAQLKAALMGSTFQPPQNTPVFDQGAGRLDVARGYNQMVLANPPAVSLGRQVGPHGDDPVINRTITYTNTNTSSGVNLTLSLATQAPGGGPAPAGMFALSTTSLSLAPGGTASVTFTATTSVSAPDGFYGGWVVATGNAGGVRVATPFAVDRSAPGREITFNHLNRSGQNTPGYVTLLLPLTTGKPLYTILSNLPAGPSGPRTEFIEDGDYLFFNYIPEVGTFDASVLVQPKITINASTPSQINLEASTAQSVNISVPNASALTHATEIGVGYTNNPNVGVLSTIRGAAYTKQLGPPFVFTANFMTKVQRTAYVPVSPGAGPDNTPTLYNVAWFPEQVFPTGFSKTVTTGQLAQRNVTFGRDITGAIGTKSLQAQPPGTLFNPNLASDITIFDLPHSRTEFFNTENNIRWTGFLLERIFPAGGGETFVQSQESAPTQYTAATTGAEAWNKPVYGPAIGTLFRAEDWVVRKGNTIIYLPPMLGDSDGHSGHAWNFNPQLPGLSGQAVLKRNGVVVATTSLPRDPLLPRPSVTVPPEWLPYTLEATVSRGGPTELATTVSAVWSFNSSSVDPNAILRLPLWSVTFRPNLNATNGAPAGSFAIPLTAVSQPGSPVAGINTITVQYSTDDGATWQNATVTGSGPNRTATVTNPGTSGYVSLRATATDWAGNSVTQTTIRAYRVGP